MYARTRQSLLMITDKSLMLGGVTLSVRLIPTWVFYILQKHSPKERLDLAGVRVLLDWGHMIRG